MKDVPGYQEEDGHFIVDTVHPHYVTFVDDVMDLDVVKEGY